MRNRGFTLIELIIVIVVLGILAVTAAPRFVNLSNSAQISALKGIAGSLHHVVEMTKVQAHLQQRTHQFNYLMDIEGVTVRAYYDAVRETWVGQNGATGLQGLLNGEFDYLGRSAHSNASLLTETCTDAQFCIVDLTTTTTVIPGKGGYGLFFFPRGKKLNENCFAYYSFQVSGGEVVYSEVDTVETGCV